ncbi:MAG TPA: hypothetical protein VFK88_09240 [Gallionella sp.]|nr:hypothetical protein [Gallionella sp.]
MKDILDHVVLLVVALVVKFVFMIYKVFVWVVLPVTLVLIGWLLYRGSCSFWWGAVVLALVLVAVYQLYHYADAWLPPSVGAGKWWDRLGDKFVAWIGTVKFFTSPFCMVEDPGSYRIKGADIRALLDGQKEPVNPEAKLPLQPGDILLRGYDGYVDGELIRRTGGVQGSGKYFSHAALYVGALGEQDREIVARRLQVSDGKGGYRPATEAEKDKVRNDPAYFQTGPQMLIHSMSKGVFVEDILTFVRCDYLIVLRLPDVIKLGEPELKNKPLLELAEEALKIDSDLVQGMHHDRKDIVAAARRSALGRIGSAYDFQFDNSTTFHRFSCSGFVYYCYKSVQRYIGVEPKKHSFAGLFSRITVSPTDIYDAAARQGKLEIVWTNVP